MKILTYQEIWTSLNLRQPLISWEPRKRCKISFIQYSHYKLIEGREVEKFKEQSKSSLRKYGLFRTQLKHRI